MLGAPFAAVSLLLFATLLPAQQALPTPASPLPKEEFRARRQALAKELVAAHPERRLVVLLRGAGKAADMGPFVQAQDFLYLSGVERTGPDAAAGARCRRHARHRCAAGAAVLALRGDLGR